MWKKLVGFITGVQDKNRKQNQDIKAYQSEQQFKRGGGVSPLPDLPNPVRPVQEMPFFKNLISKIVVPQRAVAKNIPSTTPTKMSLPSPTPTQAPMTLPKTPYTYRTSKIEPKLYDAINEASPTGDIELNDYMKKMAMALATQESTGGYTTEGDFDKETNTYKSHGPYHIQRANVPVQDRYDVKKSTDLVFKEMIRNMLVNKVPKERSLRTWNWHSGYKNNGPKYNVDIPQMATTSSFLRTK